MRYFFVLLLLAFSANTIASCNSSVVKVWNLPNDRALCSTNGYFCAYTQLSGSDYNVTRCTEDPCDTETQQWEDNGDGSGQCGALPPAPEPCPEHWNVGADGSTCFPDPDNPPPEGSTNPNTGTTIGGTPSDPSSTTPNTNIPDSSEGCNPATENCNTGGGSSSSGSGTAGSGGPGGDGAEGVAAESFTGTGTSATFQGEAPDYYFDENGQMWERQGAALCSEGGATCTGEYAQTDIVFNENDTSNIPEGTYADPSSEPVNSSFCGGDCINPFQTPSMQDTYIVDINEITEADIATQTIRTIYEQTEVTREGERVVTRTEDTESTVDGSRRTTTTTTTTSRNGTVTRQTQQSETDSNGLTVITRTGTATDSGGDDGNEEEGSSGSASGGGTCTESLQCDGDPIQCAILRQQYYLRCPRVETPEITQGDFVDEIADAQTEVAQYEQDLRDTIEAIRADANALFNISISGSGTINQNMVSTQWGDIDFSFFKFTGHLNLIGFVIVALAYIRAFMIILG